ncbi:cytochrome c oxidase assembly protein COX19 [Aaosphaeria arxii CBS 175.79]|uniref:Cytochrome c oxidase assembly protein COX19 n=1 Tax=Aaosphaeria arxii CBS 175.79 TaxID=1450172 RepID=A0A6A5Y2R3_9PLEO|nr:cytochrome c oxidase assembly protein COX19 [Aaosphaeria arxii CBS 175.79]KAF2018864.1 cytochrome c oxidase assembly protein COX19 [Aaosphaeria arxii CBS 175.79]
MSAYGGPGGGQKISKPIPPERGSFPLDHDGECKHIMLSYLQCIRSHRGSNDPECRNLSKSYLSCRMDRNLMAHDSFKNLGFGDGADGDAAIPSPALNSATATSTQAQPPIQPHDKPSKS